MENPRESEDHLKVQSVPRQDLGALEDVNSPTTDKTLNDEDADSMCLFNLNHFMYICGSLYLTTTSQPLIIILVSYTPFRLALLMLLSLDTPLRRINFFLNLPLFNLAHYPLCTPSASLLLLITPRPLISALRSS